MVLRAPNGIECDKCGKRLHWDRAEWCERSDALAKAGWRWKSGIFPNEGYAFCPEHVPAYLAPA